MAASLGLDDLEDELIASFRPYINETAPGLLAVLRHSLRFAVVDEKRNEIVVDRNCFLLATVSIGLDEGSTPFRNIANWFAVWLASRVPESEILERLAESTTSPEALAAARERGAKVLPSSSIRRILPKAVQYARTLSGHSVAALRHLFLAIATDPKNVFSVPGLGWTLSAADRSDLIAHLFDRATINKEDEEEREPWRKTLEKLRAAPDVPGTQAGGGGAAATAQAASPALLVSGFFADRTDGESESADPLDTLADVQAMARLICHEDADPPISIGVFGGWGSGKSTFLEGLQREVKRISDATASKEGPKFVSPIVQIRFNAWQFADANLWASLTAEFFDQLRAGGFEAKGEQQHARLIEDLNEHVRGLSRDATRTRAALNDADAKVRAAKVEHADALERKDSAVGQALVSELVASYQRNRGSLLRMGLLPGDSSTELPRFVEIAREANSQWGQAKLIARTLRAHWKLTAFSLVVAVMLIVWMSRSWGNGAAVLAAVGAIIPSAAALLGVTRKVIEHLTPLAARLRDADTRGLNEVLETELALRMAEDDAAATREAAERAERALSRYIDPQAKSNPPRVLRYLLEDDPGTKAFEREIGLMARSRRLFEALDRIVEDRRRRQKGAPAPGEEAGPRGPTPGDDIPARIVLYIDDLDRCTHSQVYKVLQAVHLLLAFRLFVVIVAVDVNWIEGAVEKFLQEAVEDPADAADPRKRRARAIEYLAKIFQLPFWLKPLAGGKDTRFAAYVESLTGPGTSEPGTGSVVGNIAGAPASDGGARSRVPKARSKSPDPEGIGVESGKEKPDKNAAQGESALKAMELDAREVAFLGDPAIAAIAASDPRGVKRLVNVYKIARARLSEIDHSMILNRPPAYPFIAVMAAIETGQSAEDADAVYSLLKNESFASDRLGDRWTSWPKPIQSAFAAAVEERQGVDSALKDVLPIARVVRRYSFNKYN